MFLDHMTVLQWDKSTTHAINQTTEVLCYMIMIVNREFLKAASQRMLVRK